MSDEECKTCGRKDEGHYLGCVNTHPYRAELDYSAPPEAVEVVGVDGDTLTLKAGEKCALDGCAFVRRPKGKGRAPIYCKIHSDPKNRK